jgi:hypothetical protein
VKITRARLQQIIREEVRASAMLRPAGRAASDGGHWTDIPQLKALSWTNPVVFMAALADDAPDQSELTSHVRGWLGKNTGLLETVATVLDITTIAASVTGVGIPAGAVVAGTSSAFDLAAAVGNFNAGRNEQGFFNLLGASVPGVSAQPAFLLYKGMKAMLGPGTVVLLKGAPDNFVTAINALVSLGIDFASWISENEDRVDRVIEVLTEALDAEEMTDVTLVNNIEDRVMDGVDTTAGELRRMESALKQAKLYKHWKKLP